MIKHQPTPAAGLASDPHRAAVVAELRAELTAIASTFNELQREAEGALQLPGGQQLYYAVRDLRAVADVHLGEQPRAPGTLEGAREQLAQVRQLVATVSSSRRRIAEAVEQAQREREGRARAQADLIASIAEGVPAAVASARAEAQEAERAARADLDAARAQMRQHEQTPPASRAETAAWARQLGALRDEVAAYELLHGQAAAALERAEGAYQAAFVAAWERAEQKAAETLAAVRAEGERAVAEAQAALEQAKRDAAGHVNRAHEALQAVQHVRPRD